MKYDFDEIIPRRGTKSIKWDNDNARDCLPLWVADMDFRVSRPILDALQKRVNHGLMGYAYKPEEYYESVINWYRRRHGWTIDREHILCTAGIIPTLSAIIQAMSKEGGQVAIHVPSYNCFFESPVNAHRILSRINLLNTDNHYEIDWQAMEEGLQAADMFILCNPHNPTGRVWTRDELQGIDRLCRRYGVFVVADEIHAPLAFPGIDYTPYATVAEGDNYCVCTSSPKAFKTAGLPISNIIVPNRDIRERLKEHIEMNRVGDVGPLALETLMAAYDESEDWLDQAREYIHDNYLYLCYWAEQYKSLVQPMRMEGTYLVWMKIADTGMDATTLTERLREEQKLMINAGKMYGDDRYVRINIACPRKIVEEALLRFGNFLDPLL